MVKITIQSSRNWLQEPRPPAGEMTSVPSGWRGPHLARLDAWFERRERILAEVAQRRGGV